MTPSRRTCAWATCAIGIAIACSWSVFPVAAHAAPTTLLIVRHADRQGEQDALTAAGVARARELVHVAGPAGTPWGDVNVRLQVPGGVQLTLFSGPPA